MKEKVRSLFFLDSPDRIIIRSRNCPGPSLAGLGNDCLPCMTVSGKQAMRLDVPGKTFNAEVNVHV